MALQNNYLHFSLGRLPNDATLFSVAHVAVPEGDCVTTACHSACHVNWHAQYIAVTCNVDVVFFPRLDVRLITVDYYTTVLAEK
jgi:hypothetical protein